jgi:2,3-bisphosphoglycerate-independent phosphoglycerate mutase
MNKPVILIILDGWGYSKVKEVNAIAEANLPNYNRYLVSYPHTYLSASGEAVGLPKGEVGYTEVGHLNLGAGKVVYQDLLRINMAILDGTFFQNSAFLSAIDHAKKNQSKMHILGLIGEGTTHASNDHLYALIRLCKENWVERLFLHLFTDGRDSAPTSAAFIIQTIEEYIKKIGIGQIASIIGRYYAMDRDNRLDRTQKAFDLIHSGMGEKFHFPREAVEQSYLRNLTDEFIPPCVITDEAGTPKGKVSENDSVIIFNFRPDRPRQIAKAFVSAAIKNLFLVTMTEYEKGLSVSAVAFPPINVIKPIGLILETRGIPQLRVAETEKQRFVTSFSTASAISRLRKRIGSLSLPKRLQRTIWRQRCQLLR